jgi:hypothetical protein
MVWMQCWLSAVNVGSKSGGVGSLLLNIQIKQWTLRFEATEPTEPTHFACI